MNKPTRNAVEEMLNDFEVHELIGSRRDVYELVVSVFKDWLTQGEDMEKLGPYVVGLVKEITDLKADNQALKGQYDKLEQSSQQIITDMAIEAHALKASMESEYIERQAKHIQALVKENMELKETLETHVWTKEEIEVAKAKGVSVWHDIDWVCEDDIRDETKEPQP